MDTAAVFCFFALAGNRARHIAANHVKWNPIALLYLYLHPVMS